MLEKEYLEEKRFRANGANAGKLFAGKELTAAQQ